MFLFEGEVGLTLTFIRPSAAEIAIEAAVLFVFQMAVVGSSFCASARGYGDAQNECCEDGFEDGFHNDVV